MSALARKQLDAVGAKLELAKRSAYLLTEIDSEEASKSEGISALERRLSHDYDRRHFNDLRSRRLNGSKSSLAYQRADYFSLTRVDRQPTSGTSLSIAEQSRLYTVGELLDGAGPSYMEACTSVQDIDCTSNARFLDDHRALERVGYQRSAIVPSSNTINRLSPAKAVRPRSVPTGKLSRAANIDKSTADHLDISIPRPRVFSHLRSRSSVDEETARTLVGQSSEERLRHSFIEGIRTKVNGYFPGGLRNQDRLSSNENVESQNSDHPYGFSKPNGHLAAQGNSRRSSRVSTSSATSSKSASTSKNSRKSTNDLESSATSRQSVADELDGDVGSSNAKSSSDTLHSDNHSVISQKGPEKRRSSSSDGSGSGDNIGNAARSPRKQQRRVVSPPRRRKGAPVPTAMDNNAANVSTRKQRHHDSATIQAYMKRKREERRKASEVKESGQLHIDKKGHNYGHDELQEFMKQRKANDHLQRQKAVERMEAAKLEQRNRLKEILDEQKKRKRVPVANMVGGGPAPASMEKPNAAEIIAANTTPLEGYERRVSAVRSKYNFGDDKASAAVEPSAKDASEVHSLDTKRAPKSSSSIDPSSNQVQMFNGLRVAPQPTPSVVLNPMDHRGDVDEYNIVNTILRKHPYLRVTTVFTPAETSSVGLQPLVNGKRDDRISNSRRGSDHVGRPSAVGQRTETNKAHNAPAAVAKNIDQRQSFWNESDDDDHLSALLNSPISDDGLSSVSSLTLSSNTDRIDGNQSAAKDRPASANGTTAVANDRDSEEASSSISAPHEPSGTANLRLRAGLNYMQALQYSVEQIEAAKDISSHVLAQRNVEMLDSLLQAHLAARQWEQQMQNARNSSDLQRLRAEMDRTSAAHELRLATEMTENQRRMVDSILRANQELVDQYRRAEQARSSDRAPFMDATKLAADVAASAATAATLAAVKHGMKAQAASNAESRSTSATSSLSSAVTSSSIPTRSKTNVDDDRTIREDSERSPTTANRLAKEKSTVSASSEISSIASVSSASRNDGVGQKTSSIQTAADLRLDSAMNTDRASTLPEQIVTENGSRSTTSRSTQASPTQSEIGTQTKEISTGPAVGSSKTSGSVVEEILDAVRSISDKTSSEIPTIPSASSSTSATNEVTTRSESTVKASRGEQRSSELSSSSASSTERTVEKIPAVSSGRRLRLNQLALDDNFSFSMSDTSEHESRVQALRDSLDDRRRIAQKLKVEYKRRVKERLENTEKSLLNQLKAYDVYIENTEKQLKEMNVVHQARPSTPPRILSPRLSSDAEIPSSPGRRSGTSSQRSARLLLSSSNSHRGDSSVAVVSSELDQAHSSERTLTETRSSEKSSSDSAPSSARSVVSPSASLVNQNHEKPMASVQSMARRQSNAETADEISEVLDEANETASVSTPSPQSVRHAEPISASKDPSQNATTVELKLDLAGRVSMDNSDIETASGLVSSARSNQSSRSSSTKRESSQNQDANSSTSQESTPRPENDSAHLPTNESSESSGLVSKDDSERPMVQHGLKNGDLEMRSNKFAEFIANAVVLETIDHCLSSWWNQLPDFDYYDETFGKSKLEMEAPELKRNRSVDAVTDSSMSAILDDAIGWAISYHKRGPPIANAKDDGSVISKHQLENIRNLVSSFEPSLPSPGGSPRTTMKSPRTPPSDRYNEAFRQPAQRVGSPELPKLAQPNFEDDDATVQDEQWMDDDFGLGSQGKEPSLSKSPRSPRHTPLDFSKFTTEIFSLVPCSKSAIDSIVDVCVGALDEQRRMGGTVGSSMKPNDLYIVGKDDGDPKELELSLHRESDRTFRDFVFELCQEIVESIYDEGKNDWTSNRGGHPKWKKPPRLRMSSYAKLRPKSVAELKAIVRDVVGLHLDLEPEKNKQRFSRQRLVSRRRLDRVDELVLAEIYEEEYDWTVYDDEELRVKFQLADNIFKSLLDDALDKPTGFASWAKA